jgi:hypothetical protein
VRPPKCPNFITLQQHNSVACITISIVFQHSSACLPQVGRLLGGADACHLRCAVPATLSLTSKLETCLLQTGWLLGGAAAKILLIPITHHIPHTCMCIVFGHSSVCLPQVGRLLGGADACHLCCAVPSRGPLAVGSLAASSGGALQGIEVFYGLPGGALRCWYVRVFMSCCRSWCCRL